MEKGWVEFKASALLHMFPQSWSDAMNMKVPSWSFLVCSEFIIVGDFKRVKARPSTMWKEP